MNENIRPTRTGNKSIPGSPEELAFAARVNDALRSLGAKVNPAQVTFPDDRVEYRLVVESGSKRHTLRSSAPFHEAENAVAKVVEGLQRWLSGAAAASDGLIGKRWGIATSDDDFM